MSNFQQDLNNIRQALIEEIRALGSTPKKSILTNGRKVFTSDERTIYRFEFPDNFIFTPAMTVQCTIGSTPRYSFTATIADVRSQFVYLTLPFDVGNGIPEMMCEWNPAEMMEILRDRYSIFPLTQNLEFFLARSFKENERTVLREPIFPSTFTPSQLQALKETIARKISIVVGERKRGKTGVAASFILSSIREGKRVLYLSSSANSLRDCITEVAEFNSVIAEENIAIYCGGLDLHEPLSIPVLQRTVQLEPQQKNDLKKLFDVIFNEYEYARTKDLQQRVEEKQKQIAEAQYQMNTLNDEANKIQHLSIVEKMRQRVGKVDLDSLQLQIQQKQALIERLQQQSDTLVNDAKKCEEMLPIPIQQRRDVERFASIKISSVDEAEMYQTISSRKCFATTIHQALKIEPAYIGNYDVVCIDDGQLFSVAEFLWMASLGKEQCVVFADVTEQPPRSVSQLEAPRTWLQKNYFTYYQQEDSDYYRFMINLLPQTVVSELELPGAKQTIFESCLTAALDDVSVDEGSTGNIYFFNTEDLNGISPQYLGKKKILPFNELNARRVIDCIKHALVNGTTTQDDILIVVPQGGQAVFLREQLKAHQFEHIEIAVLGSIRLCAKHVVIFDTTVAGLDFTLRQLDDRKFGLITLADTFNTLLSSPQEDLYVIADLGHFQTRYKERFITKLLTLMNEISKNISDVLSGVRNFDDLPSKLKQRVIYGTKHEKEVAEYISLLEQHKSVVRTTTVEVKLKNEIRSAILRILAKREHINTIAQYFETPPLFKVTLETQQYASLLPDFDSQNESNFKEVMEMWNVLVYETSHAHKPEHPLSGKAKVDSKIGTELHQLHTFYHTELEMIVEEGKHRLASSIQKIFNDVIGRKPVTASDWMNAYLIFLSRMEKYLDTIINQVRL